MVLSDKRQYVFADVALAEHAISLTLRSGRVAPIAANRVVFHPFSTESRGVLEQCVQQLSLRCADINLAVADTAFDSNHVRITLLPQHVYVRARKITTAPAHWQQQQHVQTAGGVDRGVAAGRTAPALQFNMATTDDISRVFDNLKTLRKNQQQQSPPPHQQQHQPPRHQQQQRRAQTSYATSNTNPLPSAQPTRHIGSMRVLAEPGVELPLMMGSRVMVCRGNDLPSADRFPVRHASVSRQHAVVDVGADGVCRSVTRHPLAHVTSNELDSIADMDSSNGSFVVVGSKNERLVPGLR